MFVLSKRFGKKDSSLYNKDSSLPAGYKNLAVLWMFFMFFFSLTSLSCVGVKFASSQFRPFQSLALCYIFVMFHHWHWPVVFSELKESVHL